MEKILSELESRFKREGFHPFFLAFIVHPVFHQVEIKIMDESEKNNGNCTDNKIFLSRVRLLTASVFYYKKHKLHKECATATEKRGGKDIEKKASKMDERKIFGGNGRY